jgi:hypothetical protein
MMRTMMARTGAAAAAAVVLLAACTSTTLVSSWKDPAYSGPPITKMAVFVASKDEGRRRFAEDQARAAGAAAGVQVVPAYTMFKDDELTEANKDAIKARLTRDGFQAALVVRLVAKDEKEVYVPPQVQFMPAPAPFYPAPYYRSFYGYYGYAFGYGYTTPGYTYVDTRYLIESILFDLPEGEPVWTATLESANPDSRAQVAQEVSRIIGDELRKNGFIR